MVALDWVEYTESLEVGRDPGHSQRLPLMEMEVQGDLGFGVWKQSKVEMSCRCSAKLPSAECGVRGRALGWRSQGPLLLGKGPPALLNPPPPA